MLVNGYRIEFERAKEKKSAVVLLAGVPETTTKPSWTVQRALFPRHGPYALAMVASSKERVILRICTWQKFLIEIRRIKFNSLEAISSLSLALLVLSNPVGRSLSENRRAEFRLWNIRLRP